jgi:hypothetical protein
VSKPDAVFVIKATRAEDGWLLDVTLDSDEKLTTMELTDIMVGTTNMVLDDKDEWNFR